MAQIFLVALLLLALPPLAGADERAEFLVGYRAYKTALAADERGDLAGALAGYRDAHRLYSEVQAKYPDFETNMIDFRIKKLQARIQELEKQLNAINNARVEGNLLDINMEQQAKIDRLTHETEEQQTELLRLRRALGDARAELAKSAEASEHRDRLLWENRQLKQDIEGLKKQVADLTKAQPDDHAAAALAAAQAQAEAHRQEKAQLEQRQAELRAANDALRLEVAAAKQRIADMTVKKSAGELEAVDAMRQAAAARERITRLEKSLAETTKLADSKGAALAASRQTVADREAQIQELTAALNALKGGDGAAALIQEQTALRDQLRAAQTAQRQAELERTRAKAELDALQLADALGGLDHAAEAEAQPARVAEGVLQDRDTLQTELTALRARYDALQGIEKNLEDEIRRLRQQAADQQKAYDQLLLKRQSDDGTMEVDTETQAYLVRLKRQHKAEIDILNRKLKTLLAQLEEARTELATRPAVTPQTGDDSFEELPDRVQTLLRRAVEAEAAGNRQTAMHFYGQVLRVVPDDPMALTRMGNLAVDDGDMDTAEQYLARAFYLAPDDRDVLLPLGAVYIRKGQYDMAVSLLARAAALYTEDAEIHRHFGVACARMGWKDVAERELLRALELDETDAVSAFNLAILYATREPAAINEARKWYTRARELGAAPDPGMDQLLEAQP